MQQLVQSNGKLMRYFFIGNLTFKLISTFKYFTYATVTMTTNIGASVLQINSFNLEHTSLSLIRLDFEKLALVVLVERYEVWVILGMFVGSSQDFIQSIQCWMICKNKCYTVIDFFVSYLKRNSSLYQFYSFNF